MKYHSLLIFVIILSFLFNENLSEIRGYIKQVENGDMNIPYQKIYSYEKIVPEHPLYLYLRGLIDIDGEESMRYYKRLYDLAPNHEYADNAAMKVGEYYYSKGLYVQAADWLKKMPVYYPRSDQSQDAVDLFLKSLIISGKKDTAMFYLKIIRNQMPNVKVNESYINMLEEIDISKSPSNIPVVLGQSFYLQIGVYRDYNNARKVRDILNLKGFESQIKHINSNNSKLYTVVEGRYPNRATAEKTSNKIKSLLTYDSIIKQHE